jgi:hypothetical protein
LANTNQLRLVDCPPDFQVIHTFEVPADRWEAVTTWFRKLRKKIKPKKGTEQVEYAAIRSSPDVDTFVVMATHVPPGATKVETHDGRLDIRDDIKARFAEVIDKIQVGTPECIDQKPYLSSRGWKLIKTKEDPTHKWTFQGRCTASEQRIHDVMKQLGIPWNGGFGSNNRWRPWRADSWWVGKIPDLNLFLALLNEETQPMTREMFEPKSEPVTIYESLDEEVADSFHARI